MWSRPPRCWPRPAASRSTRSRGRPRRISSGCSPRCRGRRGGGGMTLAVHHPRLRLLRRRAAAGARLGRLRSEQSEEPPPALLAPGRAPRRRRRDPRPGRHLAGPARAASRRRRRLARRRALHPRARRPHPRHRRSARALHQPAPARSTSISTSDTSQARCTPASAIASRTPPGSDYPPIVQRAPARGRPAGHDRRGRAARSPPCRSCSSTATSPSLGFRFGGLAYSCDLSRPAGRERRGAGRPRRLDRRRAALRAASEPFQRSTTRWPGSSACKPQPRHPDQPARRSRLRGAARPSCRRTSSRPMTAWHWPPTEAVSYDSPATADIAGRHAACGGVAVVTVDVRAWPCRSHTWRRTVPITAAATVTAAMMATMVQPRMIVRNTVASNSGACRSAP